MGRIDEALKRTASAGGASGATIHSRQLAESPWAVAETPEAAPPTMRFQDAPALVPSVRDDGPTRGLVQFSSQWRERLAAGPEGDQGLTEQFRRLAATLHHAQLANGLKDVMLTSATAGDGKTLTAVNLALVLAESYRYRVLLVDADLRRPSIPNVADVADGFGLSDALTSATEQKLALVPITTRLTLLPAGRPIANSIEALTSPRMRQILDEAGARFDWVILDAPPVGPATDARLLAQMVGGTLFVVRAGQTQCPEVQKAIDAIGREQILGVVLNAVEPTGDAAYYYNAAGA